MIALVLVALVFAYVLGLVTVPLALIAATCRLGEVDE